MGLPHTVDEHITFVGKYYGLAIPIRNFNKVYNVSIAALDEGRSSVKSVIGKKWGAGIRNRVIEQTVKDLQTSRTRANDPLSKALGALQSNWVSATLNFNLSVSMKQAASYPTAIYVLGTKALAKALKSVRPLREIIAEIDAHTGIHYKRRLGQSTQELGDRATSKSAVKQMTDKVDDLLTDVLHIPTGALPSNWIQTVDVLTTAKLWEAAKFYVEDTLTIKPEDARYWNEVTRIYEKAIEETQPNYDVLHRPEVQKSANQLLRAILMFQTQPLQNSGILYESVLNFKAKDRAYRENPTAENKQKRDEAKNECGRAVAALVSSALVFALMTAAAAFAYHRVNKYRDENGDVLLQKIAASIGWDVMGQAFNTTVPIFGSDIIGIGQKLAGNGYDIEAPVLSLVNDLVDDAKRLIDAANKVTGEESYKSIGEKVGILTESANRLLKTTSDFFGVPVKNAEKLFGGVKGYVTDAKDGALFSDGKADYTPNYVYSHADLAGAIASGNTKKEKKIRQYFTDNGREISKGSVTKYVKPAYMRYYRENPAKAEKIRKSLVENYGYKAEAVAGWVYSALAEAIASNDSKTEQKIRVLMQNDRAMKQLVSQKKKKNKYYLGNRIAAHLKKCISNTARRTPKRQNVLKRS